MAFSLNRSQLIGNLTRDPEVRMAGASKVATFGVATSFSWKDQNGERKEKTEFHNVVAWRKLAEICEQYLKKGAKVYIEGRMQTRDWEGEDGVKRYRTEIVIENMIMLGAKGERTSGTYTSTDSTQSSGGVDMDSGGSSFQAPRQQRNVKKAAPSDGNDQQGAPQEEEVSIDDLPF